MKSTIIRHSVTIDGRKTSISLEDPFWTALKEIAHAQHMTLSVLIAEIDDTRDQGNNLSSAIRLFIAGHFRHPSGLRSNGHHRGQNGLEPTLRPPAS